MALGKTGDVVSFTYSAATHYGIVLRKYDANADGTDDTNLVAFKFGGKANKLEWALEATTTSVTVLSGSDAIHG